MRRTFALCCATFLCAVITTATIARGASPDDAKRLAKAAAVTFDYDNRKQVVANSLSLKSPEGLSLEKITLKPDGEAHIPLLLTLPSKRNGPVPLVVLLHGLGGNKRQLVDLYARRLAEKGIATAAFDLDGHGERKTAENDFRQKLGRGNLLAVGLSISRNVVDGRRVIDYAATRDELDSVKTAVMGYSLGSCIGCMLANAEPRVIGLVMNAGGTSRQLLASINRNSAAAAFARMYRPMVHAPGISPRPVLMINGSRDRVFPPADARLLFAALDKPKEIRWYNTGHRLSARAADDGALWLEKLLLADKAVERSRPSQ